MVNLVLSSESHSFSTSPDRLHFSEMEDMTGSLIKKVLLLLSLVVVTVVPVLKLYKYGSYLFTIFCYTDVTKQMLYVTSVCFRELPVVVRLLNTWVVFRDKEHIMIHSVMCKVDELEMASCKVDGLASDVCLNCCSVKKKINALQIFKYVLYSELQVLQV